MIKLSLSRFYWLLLFIITVNFAKAQNVRLKQEANFTTKEIYDLMVDRHGFLWLASDIGIARYDGTNYVNFTNSLQFSLGCTGLMEDKYGRIWFNNFLGQIFYIEHEQVHFIKAFDYKTEHSFARMALFNDQLVATSDKGLFILDINTLKSKYIKASNSTETSTSSLALFKDKLLILKGNNWFLYKTDGSFKKVPFAGNTKKPTDIITLHNVAYKDTAYLICNPSGMLKKLVLKGDTVKECSTTAYNSFINTMSIDSSHRWINTVAASYQLPNGPKVEGYNISDIVEDHEGNRWFSSLNHGLLVNYAENIADDVQIPILDKGDLVLSVKKYNNQLLIGTQNGFLILYDPALKATVWKINIGGTTGSIKNINAIGNNQFVVSTSTVTYKIDIATKKLTNLANIQTAKQVTSDDDLIYIAAAGGVFLIPKNNTDSIRQVINRRFNHVLKYDDKQQYFYLNKRCRAACYYPEMQTMVVSFKDGVYQINKQGIGPVNFKNTQVYAAAIVCSNHKLFIGTINNGMLIMDQTHISQVSAADGLFSSTIFRFKTIGNHLWIIGSGDVQLFDSQLSAIEKGYILPSSFKAQVSDLEEINHLIYLTTYSGLYSFPLIKTTRKPTLKNYLLESKVNNENIIDGKSPNLPYTKNTITFKIGVPAYNNAKDIYIKYCLVTKSDSLWQVTEPGERTISFSSLMPGDYQFKAFAVDPRLGAANTIMRYNFSISPPWWDTLWVKIIFYFFILLVILYLVINFNLKKQKLKNSLILQQELIRTERQRISGEIHDDIGSGIFAIHLFAELASKKREGIEEIKQISSMINDIADKIKEIIWSTNVENDNLENLIYFIQFQTTKLFENTDIDFRSEIPDDIIDLNISIQNRRNIYLTVKELVHNAIKHAKATRIDLDITIGDTFLTFVIKDNGTGFNPNKVKPNAMGLENIRLRVTKLKGEFTIENNNGTSIIIRVPLNQISLDYIIAKRRRNFWLW